MTGNDEKVLAHITACPGLSMFEIGRALGWCTREKPGSGITRVMWALMHLMQDRLVRFERVRAPAPGGYKHLWYPATGAAPGPPGPATPPPAAKPAPAKPGPAPGTAGRR